MTKDEALRLALKALKSIDEAMPFPVAKLAIKECKAALEAKDEPVALEAVYETIIDWDEGGGKRSRRELAQRIVALYTTPPQRKPLTDDEIEAKFKKCGGKWNGDQWVIEDADLHPFVRSIESPDLKTLQAVSDEYNEWIRHHAAGHTYDDFLTRRKAAHGIKENT